MATIIKHTSSTPKSKQRIGIYGGSFNPIHMGHLLTATYLVDNGYLDEVRFLLNPCSPYKKNSKMPDAYYRAKCIIAALSTRIVKSLNDEPHVARNKMSLDNTEMLHSINHRVCYTVNTMKEILYKGLSTSNDEYYLIMGVDVFNTIKKFKKYKWFLDEKIVKFIILPRGGYEVDPQLLEEYRDIIVPVDFSKFNPIELSATEVRDKIKEGDDEYLKNVLDRNTLSYIKDKGLYGYPVPEDIEAVEAFDEEAVFGSSYSTEEAKEPWTILTKEECREMLENAEPYSWNINGIHNGYARMQVTKPNGYQAFCIYDFHSRCPVGGYWFNAATNIFTYDTYKLPNGKTFQYCNSPYKIGWFMRNGAITYYAIVVIGTEKVQGGSRSIDLYDIIWFNGDGHGFVFNRNSYKGYCITNIRETKMRGVVEITYREPVIDATLHTVYYDILSKKEMQY